MPFVWRLEVALIIGGPIPGEYHKLPLILPHKDAVPGYQVKRQAQKGPQGIQDLEGIAMTLRLKLTPRHQEL